MVITQTGCLSGFGETKGDFGVRDIRIGLPRCVSVFPSHTPCEISLHRKLLRESGIHRRCCACLSGSARKNPGVEIVSTPGFKWGAAGSQADCGVLTSLQRQGDRRGWARSHGVDAENLRFSSVFEPSGIAEAFSESKCLCLNFEVRVVRSNFFDGPRPSKK